MPTYDPVGNLTSDGQNSYAYNTANQLVGYTAHPFGDTNTILNSLTYTYDPLGNRTHRHMAVGGDTGDTDYVLDINGPLSQVLRENDTLVKGGVESGAQRTYMLGADVLGFEEDSSATGFEPHWTFFGYDALGSVRQTYYDDEQANLHFIVSYDPFGSVMSQAGVNPSAVGFAGEQTDPNGLQYLRARYMNPATGTFLSRDPVEGSMGRVASMNGYGYAEGNPAVNVDPSGQCIGPLVILCAAAIGAAIGMTVDGGLQLADIAIHHRALASFSWGQNLRIGAVGAVGGGFGAGFVAFGGALAGSLSITAATSGATELGALTIGLSGVVGGRAATLTNNILSGQNALEDYWNPFSMARDALFAVGGTYLFGRVANAITGANRNYFTAFLPKLRPIDPVVDNNILVRAYRAYAGGKTYDGDVEALQLLQNQNYQWKVPPEVYDEFTGVPVGAADRQQFLNDLSNLDVISAAEAQQLQNGQTFQDISARLRAIANRSASGLGDPVVPGGRPHTHYNDIMSLSYAEEMGIPFVTDDKKFIQFLINQDKNNTYNIFHYLNFK